VDPIQLVQARVTSILRSSTVNWQEPVGTPNCVGGAGTSSPVSKTRRSTIARRLNVHSEQHIRTPNGHMPAHPLPSS